MGEGGQRHAAAALPPGKTRYPLYSRLGGPQSRSGRVRKISPPPGFFFLEFNANKIEYIRIQNMNYKVHTRLLLFK